MVNYDGLEKILKERGILKSDLSRQLGISSRTIAKISKGEKISSRIMLKIADFLQCSEKDLFFEKKDKTIYADPSLKRNIAIELVEMNL